jgi:hypothetical protein
MTTLNINGRATLRLDAPVKSARLTGRALRGLSLRLA